MDKYTKANFIKVKNMERVHTYGQTEINILEIFNVIKDKISGSIHGEIIVYIKDNGMQIE